MPIYQKLGPKEVESMGVKEALSRIKQMGFMKVSVEMDSQVVFNALKISFQSTSPFALLIKDCQEMVKIMDNIMFSFAKRSVNSVAHVVARATGSMSDIAV